MEDVVDQFAQLSIRRIRSFKVKATHYNDL